MIQSSNNNNNTNKNANKNNITSELNKVQQQLKKVLDWKLSFHDQSWQEHYDKQFQNVFLVSFRWSLCFILVVGIIGCSYVGFFKKSSQYLVIVPIAIEIIIFFVLSWRVHSRMALLASSAYVTLALTYLSETVIRDDFDPKAFVLSIAILLAFTTQRVPIVYGIPYVIIPVIFQIVATLVIFSDSTSYYLFGCILIIGITFIISIFAGYSLEKLTKFVFVYKHLMTLEAKKLSWAIDRDVTLLRNIFPKNLSDELQLQMESGKRMGKKLDKGSGGVIRDYLNSSDTEQEEHYIEQDKDGQDKNELARSREADETGLERPVHPRMNPLVRIISSFSGRERAGWSTLESLTPLPTNPLPAHQSPLSSSSSPSGYLDDLFQSPDSSEQPAASFPFSHDYLSTPPISNFSSGNPPVRTSSELSPSNSFNFSAFSNNGSSKEVVRSPSRERAQSVPSPPLTPRSGLQVSTSFIRRAPSSYAKIGSPSTPSSRGMPKVSSNPLRRLAVQTSPSVTSNVLSPLSHASTPTSSSPIYSLTPVVEQKQFTSNLPERHLTTSGRALHTQHGPELHTYFIGAHHADGSLISLSHFYPSVTVILADISGFTMITRSSTAQNAVDVLNTVFSMFDEIIEEYQFEKIRTIGDAYLCVANMSIPVHDHESKAIKAAHQMRKALRDTKGMLLKVGIASGSCIAGVTGKTRWNYDIFGDVITEVMLMESATQADIVSVSPGIYNVCKDNKEFKFEKRQDSSGIERYSVITTSNCDLEIDIDRYSQSSDSTDKYEQMPLFSPPIRVPKIDQLDDVDFMTKPVDADIPLTDFQYDDLNQFDYTKEDLELEVTQLEQSKIVLTFHKPAFEDEYLNTILRKTYPFTTKFILLLLLTVPFYIVIDVCTTFPSPLNEGVFVVHALKFALMFGCFWMVHLFNDWRYAGLAGGVVIGLFAFFTIIIGFLQHTIYHVQRTLIVLITLSICMRMRRNIMVGIILVPVCILGSILTFFEPYTLLMFPLHYLILACGIYTQTNIERNFRMSFLVRKVIAFNEHHQKRALQRAKLLMHNILPDEIIPMLHRKGPRQIESLARLFDEATIMFVNITNLNDITSHLTSEQAFSFYNEIITRFDEATRKAGLQKIKTVNTTYMIAAGLPKGLSNHTDMAINLALEFSKIVKLFSGREGENRELPMIRVGIEVGPVIAGVVGKKKFAYDCWSETVNEAARLETTGVEGYAHVSSNVYELLHTKYSFTQAKESGKRATFMCKL